MHWFQCKDIEVPSLDVSLIHKPWTWRKTFLISHKIHCTLQYTSCFVWKPVGHRHLNAAERPVVGWFWFSKYVSWKVYMFYLRQLIKQIKLYCKQAPDLCLCFVSPAYWSNRIGKWCHLLSSGTSSSTNSSILQCSAFCLQKGMVGKELLPSYSMFVCLKISLLNKTDPRTQISSLVLECSSHFNLLGQR